MGMVKRGLWEMEALLIYKLNEKVRIKTDTPFGETEQITRGITVRGAWGAAPPLLQRLSAIS